MKKKIGLFVAVMVLAVSVFAGSPQAAQASSDELTQEQLDVLLELEGAARGYYQDKIDSGQMPDLNDPQACEWKLTEPTKENRLASILERQPYYVIFTTIVCEDKKGETLAQAIYRHERIDLDEITSSSSLSEDSEWLEGDFLSFFDRTTNEWTSYTAGDYMFYNVDAEKFNYREQKTEILIHSFDNSEPLPKWELPAKDLFTFLQDPQWIGPKQ